MSKSELKKIEKNLKLSAELQEYILKIILDEDTEKIKKNNIYKAVKSKSGWQLIPA